MKITTNKLLIWAMWTLAIIDFIGIQIVVVLAGMGRL